MPTLAFSLTLAVTLAGVYGFKGVSPEGPKTGKSYLVKITDRNINIPVEKPPKSPKPALPENRPEKEDPKPKKKQKPDPIPKVAEIKSSPRTHKSAPEPPEKPAREVFGVELNSVAANGDPPAPVGNTLMKEAEEEFTPPEKVKSIYSPPEVDDAPKYEKVIKPEYPRSARIRGIEGVVKISLVVSESGRPTQLRVLKGIGHGCEEAALQAVAKYRFTPGTIDGHPVKTRVVVPVRFKLDD